MTSRPDDAPANWYFHRSRYWAPAHDASDYPLRQGDLLGPMTVDGNAWDAALLLHPTCELSKPSAETMQVTRVRFMSALVDDHQRVAVQAGFRERRGTIAIAFAHTFYLPPPESSDLVSPMYCDFREIVSVPRSAASAETRVAAMTHDARVTLIRRYTYFRFRIALPFDQIRMLEAARIRADANFVGPRPAWA